MQKIKKMYRSDYMGEEIVKDLVWSDLQWNRTNEYVPNNVINNQISNTAVIIGNGPSRTQLTTLQNIFDLLKNHKGGLLATGRAQTYGCNALYRDFWPDFLIVNGNNIAQEVANNYDCENKIVYANSDAVLSYPGKFYLTPQNPYWDAGAVAAYLACFDGHKRVYLMGFDGHSGQPDEHYNVYTGTTNYADSQFEVNTEAFTSKSLKHVMDLYTDVDFVRVMPTPDWYMPDLWKYQLNLRQIDFQAFVQEIDL